MSDLQETRIVSGEISSIESQKKSKDRISIFIGGEFAFGLHADVLIERGLYKGQILSETEVHALLNEDAFYRAQFKAYHLLSYRARTSHELSQRLSKAGFENHTVNRVNDRLCELGMIDDLSFARDFTEARIRSKGYGPLRIRNELFKKGIPSDFIDEALASAYVDAAPADLALKAAQKYFRRLEKETDHHKRRSKLSSFLARRGFSFDQMHLAMEELQVLERKAE